MSASPSNVRSSLWFLPVVCVAGGIVLSITANLLDRWSDFDLVPEWLTGGPESASAILESIAVSAVSLATLVLTITMVVVQLAMGQFSPRIVQTFLQDRPSQLAIGLFVGTFAHSLLTMREVQHDGEGQVPGIGVVVAFVLALISIAMLVKYVDHIGRSLRVSSLIELVGSETRELLDRDFPHRDAAEAPEDVITAPRSRVLIGVDREALADLAGSVGCVLHVVPAVGSFVPAGAPLVRVEGPVARLDREKVLGALRLGLERTMDEDLAYGFRLLTDMAVRSLAESSLMDPTTAVQCIDRLHDGLRQLAVRQIPDGLVHDRAGEVRVTIPTPDWDTYVRLCFDEIRRASSGSPQVTRRLVAAIDDLLEVAPADRRPPLRHQLELLAADIHAAESGDRPDGGNGADGEVPFDLRPDPQGIGAPVRELPGSA